MSTDTASKKVEMVRAIYVTLPDGIKLSVTAQHYFIGVYATWSENGTTIYQGTASSIQAWNRLIRNTIQQMRKEGLTVEIVTKKVIPCSEHEVNDVIKNLFYDKGSL